jgi:hypothetical protein
MAAVSIEEILSQPERRGPKRPEIAIEATVSGFLHGDYKERAITHSYEYARRQLAIAIEETTRDGRPYVVRRWEDRRIGAMGDTIIRASAFAALAEPRDVREPGEVVISPLLDSQGADPSGLITYEGRRFRLRLYAPFGTWPHVRCWEYRGLE